MVIIIKEPNAKNADILLMCYILVQTELCLGKLDKQCMIFVHFALKRHELR